jgi:hypothetical protein
MMMNDAQKNDAQNQDQRTPSVGAEKIRLKFRVSQFEGRSSSSAKWTEKWGVGLLPHEEFHATDQLLKLPFIESPPKSVCVFSVADTLLRFRMLDDDRVSEVNGVPKKESLLVVGDRVRIGEGIVIEVLVAPGKPMNRSKVAESSDGPTLMFSKDGFFPPAAQEGPEITDPTRRMSTPDPEPVADREDKAPQAAPTPMPMEVEGKSEAIPTIARPGAELPEIQEPSLQTELRKASQRAAQAAAQSSDGEAPGHTVETVRPELVEDVHSPRSARSPFLMPEPKVELADVPHAVRDDSLNSRSEKKAPADEGIEPFYAEQPPLDERPTLAERLLAVVAKVMRRDDLNPPSERFPLDASQDSEELAARSPQPRSPEPWNPQSQPKRQEVRSSASSSTQRKASASPQPWPLPRETLAARRRGRALVFLVAACGALMLAVGIFRIVNRVQEVEKLHVEGRSSLRPLKPGVPIEHLQEKVRRMQRR